MSFTPENSAIKLSKEQNDKVSSLVSADEIKAYLASVAVDSNLVRRDLYSPDVLIPVEPGTAPRGYAKTITDDTGRKLVFEADSELKLERSIGDYFRSLHPTAASETRTETQRDATTGRFTAAPSPEEQAAEEARKAALSLQFQLGQIDAATYIEKSGAVADYLEKAGVPLEDLQAAVAEKQNERFTQSWEQATDAFLNSPEGADWPGGENLKVIGKLLADNNLEQSPSVETLAACWNFMKENGMAVENTEVAAHQRISDATSFEEIRQAGSSLFGR